MSLSARDVNLLRFLALAAAMAAAVLILIVLFLVQESWQVLARIGILPFITDRGWHPTEGTFGLFPMLVGSLTAALGTVVVAAPLGIASAVFCRIYAPPPVAIIYRWTIILLAGMPSVVLGLWGLTALVPLITAIRPPGTSLLAAILVLALMILPTIALMAESAIRAVPQAYWQGALALGLSREAALLQVILPAARIGISSGILLAVGRALGETMAVLMVSGNVVQLPATLLDPVRTLTANVALEMAYATGDHRSSLFVSGLMLTVLVALLSIMATRLNGGRAHG